MAITAANSATAFCMSTPPKWPSTQKRGESPTTRLQSSDPSPESGKIVLQPRLCTLRSYSSNSTRDGVVREDPSSPFYASLADYIDNSRKSQDFETISGRLAMLVFAGAVGVELATGDSLFKKLDLEEMAEAAGVCLAVVACAAAFAWASSARASVGRFFSLSCNSFVDSFVDQLIDGLFYDADPCDWSDDV